jgi:hypothetical protein
MRPRTRTLFAFAFIAIAGVLLLWKPSPLPIYQAVVANVAAGKQAVSKNGVITLPPGQASYTHRGKAYATSQPTGPAMILFPVAWGKAVNLRGYLYCPGPALVLGSSVAVNVPIPSPVLAPEFGMADVVVESVEAPCWYYVTRSLD